MTSRPPLHALKSFVVEVASFPDLGDVAGTDGKITEMLVLVPVASVVSEHLVERGQDRRLGDILEIHLVQPLAVEAAAQVKVVFAGGQSGEVDLGYIGAGAAVGATGHANRDRLLREA